jgi:hypothetical protein
MEIVSLNVRWMHGYANKPGFEAIVNEIPARDSWVYESIEDPQGWMLISTTNRPWYRFVYIEKKHINGHPNRGGALGGSYRLTDGSVLESRTGWSSREGVVNTDYRGHIGGELVDVPIKSKEEAERKYASFFAGHYVEVDALRPHLPEGVYLVKDPTYLDGEVYWCPSVDPYQVVKPERN